MSDRATDLLTEAADAMADRASTRDLPDGERSMARAVRTFHALTGHLLTEVEGWTFMAVLKLSRSQAGAVHRDDFVDAAAYSALAGEAALRSSAAGRELLERATAELGGGSRPERSW